MEIQGSRAAVDCGEAADCGVDASAAMSFALAKHAEEANSRRLFQWRRAYQQGTLGAPDTDSVSMLPVVVAASGD